MWHIRFRPAPKNEDEMMVAIFEFIDRIFAIVRPRRVLYMAIDGVAPRAKMNQQRSRRFRASKETSEKMDEMARIRDEIVSRGGTVPEAKPKGEHFDRYSPLGGTEKNGHWRRNRLVFFWTRYSSLHIPLSFFSIVVWFGRWPWIGSRPKPAVTGFQMNTCSWQGLLGLLLRQ